MVLEYSNYFERYLWANVKVGEKSSSKHILSCVAMVNEKFRENVPCWHIMRPTAKKFPVFLEQVLQLTADESLNVKEQTQLLQFLIHCFSSLEQDFVRSAVIKLTSLPSWFHVNPLHRDRLLLANPTLANVWKKVSKKFKTRRRI